MFTQHELKQFHVALIPELTGSKRGGSSKKPVNTFLRVRHTKECCNENKSKIACTIHASAANN